MSRRSAKIALLRREVGSALTPKVPPIVQLRREIDIKFSELSARLGNLGALLGSNQTLGQKLGSLISTQEQAIEVLISRMRYAEGEIKELFEQTARLKKKAKRK
jgi:hypothetical protein